MKRIIYAAALVLTLCGCSFAQNDYALEQITLEPPQTKASLERQEALPENAAPTPKTQSDEQKPTDKDIALNITFAGDCTLGNDEGVTGERTFLGMANGDMDYPFKNVQKLFSSDDLTIVNLEGTFTESEDAQDKQFRFKAPPRFAAMLTRGSVEAVNLANNHTMDYGELGLTDTKKALDERGIAYCENGEMGLYTIKGVTVALLGYYVRYDADFKSELQKAREDGADVVIVCCHWGEEGAYSPGPAQINMARSLIDAGADIVFGTHPHVLQPIEVYNGNYIIYSLGNFAFGGNRNPSDKHTAAINWKIQLDETGITSQSLNVTPMRVSGSLERNDFQPCVETEPERIDRIYRLLGM